VYALHEIDSFVAVGVGILAVVLLEGLRIQLARVEVSIVALRARIEAVYIPIIEFSCFSVQFIKVYHSFLSFLIMESIQLSSSK
jgi:hypothetical protein